MGRAIFMTYHFDGEVRCSVVFLALSTALSTATEHLANPFIFFSFSSKKR